MTSRRAHRAGFAVVAGLLVGSIISAALDAYDSVAAVGRVTRAAAACHALAYTGAVPASDPGLDTTSLGSATPASYEIGAPLSFPDAGQPIQRVMILIHGGAWEVVGTRAMETERTLATAWRMAGWETVSIDYRACGHSVPDVLRFYDLIRRHVGTKVPICIAGQSAGAHLALMIAATRNGVACVIAEGAPTDLSTLASQGAQETTDHTGITRLRRGSALVGAVARSAFGRAGLAHASPVTFAARVHARLLLGRAQNDWVIPRAQASELRTAVLRANPSAYVDVNNLPAGSVGWVHGSITKAAAVDFAAATARLVAPFGRAPLTTAPLPPLLPCPPFGPAARARPAAITSRPSPRYSRLGAPCLRPVR